MEDEHLERTHRGQGALGRLLRQQAATLEHGLVWTEPVGVSVRDGHPRGASDAAAPGGWRAHTGRPRATSDAAIRGGCVQRSTRVALGWAGALGPTRERAAMQPCRVEHWDAGALRRWGAQALRRSGAGALRRSGAQALGRWGAPRGQHGWADFAPGGRAAARSPPPLAR
jgi:hypothetical protein